MGLPTERESGTVAERLGNSFGLGAALGGFAAGVLLSSIAVAIFGEASGHPSHPSTYGSNVASLLGLWVGLIGAAVIASRSRPSGSRLAVQLRQDYGLSIRLIPDLPLGIVIGVAAQYLLVPLLELPLLPFVPHLFNRLGAPARSLTAGSSTGGLVLLGLLVCLGSPIVEELFRGLFLRGLLGKLNGLRGTGTLLSVVICGLAFGLAHFEALQLIGLAGFGMVLGGLACRTGRLGPGIVAHIAFNTTTFIALATGH